jgi:hypothetical protein
MLRGNTTSGGEIFIHPYFGGGTGRGGAIYESSVSASFTNCLFVGNRALGGGKFDFYSTNETGAAHGGALCHDVGNVSIYGTLFRENAAVGGEGFTAKDVFTTSGTATGGAVFSASGMMRFENSALVSNRAVGGIDTGGAPWTTQAGDGAGGAIHNELSRTELTLINCTAADNSANGGKGLRGVQVGPLGGSAYGGAIFGNASLLNVTLSSNSVQLGDGASSPFHATPQSGGSSIYGDAILINSILVCAADQTNVLGTIFDDGHNICSDSSANFTSTSSRNSTDPLLAPLADNGGSTLTLALLPGSPAVDAGDDSVCPPTDQRGARRPEGFRCDIGSFELGPKVTLTRGQGGGCQLHCEFLAGTTNRITASTDLLSWVALGERVSDFNGRFDFDDRDAAKLSWRFYHVEMEGRR